ncbi:DUF5994 family protein [Amycolatopsis sp. FDAARGOS 1241]|uniref:DUF5994 family protein n=1 Tax=Amycolatopsis sp. FDAARGOS 1241 TaxID=2778070 RepID=UPI00194F252D|nr:DUF5994 family protein [Amycolatopsis sp. FDAARGOS 1241]QRP47916.1 hypothetical protein I6J71_08455 [Amycolatopsis sp. FDAARGOS 1241]
MAISVQPETTPEREQLSAPRLRMKQAGSERGHFDGGWWPRSTDLVAELPALSSALKQWVGPVTSVSYHLDTWGPTARKVRVGDRTVRLEGFRFTDPHTITVIGSGSRSASLLVVPPEAPRDAARAALRSVVDEEPAASAAEILSRNGISPAL